MVSDALQSRIATILTKAKTIRVVNGEATLALGTSLGRVRQQNQDCALVALATYSGTPEKNFALGVICDGIGGLDRGKEAATLAASVFASRVLRSGKHTLHERLRLGVLTANDAVYQLLRGRGGTTVCAAIIPNQGEVVFLNVGDSRVYGVTPGREVKQLSTDDTLAGYLGARNNGDAHRNQLVQYVGMGEGIEPHIQTVSPREFGSVLLTSDGIHGVPLQAFSEAIRVPSENMDLVDRLISLSDALGGRDNATAVVLPIQLPVLNQLREQGLTIEFWSVSNHLEVWVPSASEDSKGQDLPLQTDKTVSLRQNTKPEPGRRREKVAKDRAGRQKSKKQKPRETKPEQEAQPTLDITFPDKEKPS